MALLAELVNRHDAIVARIENDRAITSIGS
jgi:hypothetical protein